ncbi:ROK family protein [Brochothrix thermosphacta]|uniref:ROK family protein n=1 Tax=Brochothrix thermosphacta TaxID=2756 RepID=UPI00083FD590|nr:ROK family protein [Brochothrix thermosphacta]ODJ60026.1 fructokinase [Brochothrix thermosphacta]
MLLGAIEAGGTKFVCAVSDLELNIVERISLPTTTPEETLNAVYTFFDNYTLDALAIGSFGPIDVNKKSPTYGYITSTPKTAWKNFNLLGALKERYNLPIAFTTDVNAAAYGELKHGAAKGKESCIYLTVGTGIGGGVVINNKVIEGFSHPEMGHLVVKRHPDDHFDGVCPYHGDCLEGLAAGPAIEGRFQQKAFELPNDHKAWDIEAFYLAQAAVNYTLTLSPEIIIFGGGVSKQEQLYPKMRQYFAELMNGYYATPPLEDYLVYCDLGDNAGITGTLLLAKEAIK